LIVDALGQLRAGDAAPMYVQIERCIRLLVADGTLLVGQRLPPVRTLAQQLGLAPNTVARAAYADLVGEGVVASRAGGGSVVASPRRQAATSADQPRERLQRVARHLVAYGLALGHAPGEVIHAVRAELAALGRLESAPTEPGFEVRPTLPTHAVPAGTLASGACKHLKVHGLVAAPRFLSLDDLVRLPRATLQQPFACDEGWVVPDLCWSGVWLADVLALAEPLVAARYVRVGAGPYSLPFALAEVPDALLADELDGQPLAIEHGAPWRLVLPGGRATRASSGSTAWNSRHSRVSGRQRPGEALVTPQPDWWVPGTAAGRSGAAAATTMPAPRCFFAPASGCGNCGRTTVR
jgi:GntR family transcriptional regulator